VQADPVRGGIVEAIVSADKEADVTGTIKVGVREVRSIAQRSFWAVTRWGHQRG
jgi:hypothetical protein